MNKPTTFRHGHDVEPGSIVWVLSEGKPIQIKFLALLTGGGFLFVKPEEKFIKDKWPHFHENILRARDESFFADSLNDLIDGWLERKYEIENKHMENFNEEMNKLRKFKFPAEKSLHLSHSV